jgi:apolipoprotein D and lipocalin family protein
MKKIKVLLSLAFISLIIPLLNSCSVKIPEYVKPLNDFNTNAYSGKWYEIARFDFKYEKDLSNVTAEYIGNYDGTIKVINKGFDYKKNKWKQAIGKAKNNGSINQSTLKVSFFGPFYAGYNVVMMDPAYETALVFGQSTDYIWILSRTKTISEETKQKFLVKAQQAGYDLNRLVWTVQD